MARGYVFAKKRTTSSVEMIIRVEIDIDFPLRNRPTAAAKMFRRCMRLGSHAVATIHSTAAAEQPQPLGGTHTRKKRLCARIQGRSTAMRTKPDDPHDSPHVVTFTVHIIGFDPSREHAAAAVLTNPTARSESRVTLWAARNNRRRC